MAQRTITALYDGYADAAEAVRRLEASGVPHDDISIVAKNDGAPPSGSVGSSDGGSGLDALDGASAGATIGTVLGGGAGLLAGLGLLAVPGLGPVVAAGWVVAALTGAGIGAAAGGLVGTLAGVGVHGHDAEAYAEGVRRGGTLVTVRASDGQGDRAMEILEEQNPVDLDERVQSWGREGWQSSQARQAPTAEVAAPMLPATNEIGSTAIGAAASTATGLGTRGVGPAEGPEPEADWAQAGTLRGTDATLGGAPDRARPRVRSYSAGDRP